MGGGHFVGFVTVAVGGLCYSAYMTKQATRRDNKELLELGKKLQDFLDTGYVNRKQSLWFSFLKGIAGGFGAFLGGTIVVVLLLWFLSFFKEVPLLGPLTDRVRQTIQQ